MGRTKPYDYNLIWGLDIPILPADLANKNDAFLAYMRADLARFSRMFEWDGFPDTIKQRDVELKLLTSGQTGICPVDDIDGGGVWAIRGNMGGAPRRNLMPSMYIVSNPTLKKSYNYRIYESAPETSSPQQFDGDCVVIANDSVYMGLLPILARYNTQLVENDITMQMIDINCRAATVFSGIDDDATAASVKAFIRGLIDGKLEAIGSQDLFDKLKALPYAQSTYATAISSFIEYEQYLKASKYNDLGLNANYNMKREAINTSEAQMNDDALMPFVDDMLACRKKACEQINELFGWNVSVRLSSSWENRQEMIDAELDAAEAEAEDPEGSTEPEEKEGEEDVQTAEENS